MSDAPHGSQDEQDTTPVLKNLRSSEKSSPLDGHGLGHLIYHSQMADQQFVGGEASLPARDWPPQHV